jgi:GT2 family glycosyltransferase
VSSSHRLSVGIASRGRVASLARCITSLACLDGILDEIIVIDDGTDEPMEPAVRAGLAPVVQRKLRMMRFSPGRGLAAARSECVRQARSRWVLSLDDDTLVPSAAPVLDALRTIDSDPRVFAIAFGQDTAIGEPWPASAQPAPVAHPCWTAAFIGFAHLVQRDAFVTLGGFREQLLIFGEERELCLRALDAGLGVVYLPSARIMHLADPANRDMRRYLRLTVRNGVLSSVYDDPLPILCARVLLRLQAYFRMRRGWQVDDPGGFWQVLMWIRRDLGEALRQRRAVRWATIWRWRKLARHSPLYLGPA